MGAGSSEDYIDLPLWKQSAMVDVLNKIAEENK